MAGPGQQWMFEFAIGIISLVASIFSAKLLQNMEDHTDRVLTQFKLKAESTFNDVKILVVMELGLLVIFTVQTLTGIFGRGAMKTLTWSGFVVFTTSLAYVFYRMWRRSG